MQLNNIFLVIFLLFFSSVFAQQKELKGYLGVEHGESFTYKLSFTDSFGYIKGYAYTWLDENKDVKAKVTGFIDKKNKTLSFKETEIVYNHGFESNTTICLINATLKFKEENGLKVFTGSISSSDASNVYCGQGTIRFMDNETLKNLFNDNETNEESPKDIVKRSTAKKPFKIIYDTISKSSINQNIPQNNKTEKITSGTEKEYDWMSDSVILEVWDGGRIDGDMINILFNDSTILKRYALTQKRNRIVVPIMNNSINQLEIVAVNEGNEPPNTANLLLIDGSKQYPIIAYNTIGKKAIIRIRKTVN